MTIEFECDSETGGIIAFPFLAALTADLPGYGMLVLRLEFQCGKNEKEALQLRMLPGDAISLAETLISLASASRPESKN